MVWDGQIQYVHPNKIIQALLKETDMWTFFNHSYLADGKGKPRNEAKSMVVIFTSIQHKREATNRLIHYIKTNNIKNVGIRDCFNKQDMELIKKYKEKGKKSNKRWRILNINGKPILQTAAKGQRFEEVKDNQDHSTQDSVTQMQEQATQPQTKSMEQNPKNMQSTAQISAQERGEKQKNTQPAAVPTYGYNN